MRLTSFLRLASVAVLAYSFVAVAQEESQQSPTRKIQRKSAISGGRTAVEQKPASTQQVTRPGSAQLETRPLPQVPARAESAPAKSKAEFKKELEAKLAGGPTPIKPKTSKIIQEEPATVQEEQPAEVAPLPAGAVPPPPPMPVKFGKAKRPADAPEARPQIKKTVAPSAEKKAAEVYQKELQERLAKRAKASGQ